MGIISIVCWNLRPVIVGVHHILETWSTSATGYQSALSRGQVKPTSRAGETTQTKPFVVEWDRSNFVDPAEWPKIGLLNQGFGSMLLVFLRKMQQTQSSATMHRVTDHSQFHAVISENPRALRDQNLSELWGPLLACFHRSSTWDAWGQLIGDGEA